MRIPNAITFEKYQTHRDVSRNVFVKLSQCDDTIENRVNWLDIMQNKNKFLLRYNLTEKIENKTIINIPSTYLSCVI